MIRKRNGTTMGEISSDKMIFQTLYYNRKKLVHTICCMRGYYNTKYSVYIVERPLGITIEREREKTLIHGVDNYFPTGKKPVKPYKNGGL